jgi:hypothetical protein
MNSLHVAGLFTEITCYGLDAGIRYSEMGRNFFLTVAHILKGQVSSFFGGKHALSVKLGSDAVVQ